MGNSQRLCKRILFNMIISTSNRNDDISIYILSISTNLSHSSVPLTSAFLPRGSPPRPLRTSHPDPPRGVVPRHSTRRNDLLRCPDGPGGRSGSLGLGTTSPRFLVERKKILIIEKHHSFRWSGIFFSKFQGCFWTFWSIKMCLQQHQIWGERCFFQNLRGYW